MQRYLSLLCTLFLCAIMNAQTCEPDSLRTDQIFASATDPNIPFELARHYAWYNPTCVQNNKLLVYMVGTIDDPWSTTYFPALAANNGYHVVSLKYPNDTSAQTVCRNSPDTNCYELFRRELIEGVDVSPNNHIDSSSCVTNRLQKLLMHLHGLYPAENWDIYYTGNAINWTQTLLAGHSQGGGNAAFIAKDHAVQRVITFASPNDHSDVFNDGAAWTSMPHATPDSNYFAFGNLYDDIALFEEQMLQWDNLGLSTFGDTVRVDMSTCPYNGSHQLYTTEQRPGLAVNHSLMVRDGQTPLDVDSVPVFLPVWRYLLGLPCLPMGVYSTENAGTLSAFPNPFSDLTTIQIPTEFGGSCSLTITNAAGQVMRRQHGLHAGPLSIERVDLETGVYFFNLHDGSGKSAWGKLVVEGVE